MVLAATRTPAARPSPRPALRGLAALVLAALATSAQAGAVRLELNIGVCLGAVQQHHEITDGQDARTDRMENSQCTAEANALTGPGVILLNSRVRIDSGTWDSGSVAATSSGSFGENIQVTAMNSFDEVVSPGGLHTVLIQPKVKANGSVNASSPTPDGMGGASASFSYSVSFPGSGGARSGTMSESNGTVAGTGELGLLTGTPVLVALGSVYRVSMEAMTYASIGKVFQPSLEQFHASAQSDFLHTLLWQGIEVLDAFDANGARVVMPDGVRIAFTGADSGFDYAHAARPAMRFAADGSIVAAPPDPTGIPLPASPALLAAALAALVLSRCRGGARQASR